MVAIARWCGSCENMPAFSVRPKALVVAEALGGFGLECFGLALMVAAVGSY